VYFEVKGSGMIRKRVCIQLAIAVSCIVFPLRAKDLTSQTFFMPRSLTFNAVLENALNTYRVFHADYKEKEYRAPKKKAAFNFQKSVVYQHSSSKSDLAKYFLLGSKKVLNFDESGEGDVGSGWLDLFSDNEASPFKGTMTIKPERTVLGCTFHYHYDVSEAIDRLWIDVYLPIVQVKHDINLEETITSTVIGELSKKTIAEALNNPKWRYGKWSTKSLSKTGVDDLLFKLGYGIIRDDHFRIEGFAELLVPLADRPTAEYVFEPMIGHGGHFGAGIGFALEAEVYTSNPSALSILAQGRLHYLFSGTEIRSFDLKEREWSRYLVFNEPGRPLTFKGFFGINFLTKELRVRPGERADLWLALHFMHDWFNVEGGYNLWWKNGERVRLKDSWPHRIAITARIVDDTYLPEAKISDKWEVEGIESFTPITNNDFDFHSAAHQSALSHTLYLACSANGIVCSHPVMVGAGGSYEFADRNTALSTWTIWGSVSVGF
jgi:hypothetical protein